MSEIPTTPAAPAASTRPATGRMRRVGWFLVLAVTVLLPLWQLVAPEAPSVTLLLLLLGLVLLLLLALLLGVGLLLWSYRGFFQRAWGVALWAAVLFFALALNGALAPGGVPVAGLPRLASGLLELASAWGLAASLAIGPTLLLYLRRRDASARLFAITYLLVVWTLFAFGQGLGWEALLNGLVTNQAMRVLWPLEFLLCLGIWVSLIAPATFLWHTFRLLQREWSEE